MDPSPTQIIVLGAGFAGLNAVRVLSKHPGVRITLADQNNYHLFQPLLYQVAIAGLEAPEIAFPARAFCRRHPRASFQLGRAERVDRAARTLWLDGRPFPYDYLIVGLGTRSADFGVPGAADVALGLKTLPEAMTIRNRILAACEEAADTTDAERRRAMLTFVLIGGGPTGVELAGALAELRQHVIRRDYPELDLKEVRIVLVEAGPRLLAALSESSSAYTLRFLQDMGVEVLLQTPVTEITPAGVRTRNGRWIPSFTVVWSAGVAGAPLTGLPEPKRAGRVVTTPFLHLPDDPRVYVIGDLNYLEDPATGRPHPQVAQVAIQQGLLAARNILRELEGKPPQAFRYRDKGSMATMGRNHAVAEIGRWKFTGFVAWGMWLFVHLIELIGFRNRMLVLLNWIYSYFRYDFAVRIMHERETFPAETASPK